jgi:hypothetical protein
MRDIKKQILIGQILARRSFCGQREICIIWKTESGPLETWKPKVSTRAIEKWLNNLKGPVTIKGEFKTKSPAKHVRTVAY